jgi:hypothetical protein
MAAVRFLWVDIFLFYGSKTIWEKYRLKKSKALHDTTNANIETTKFSVK